LITVYFRDIKDGRLVRMQYVGYALLAAFLLFVLMMLSVVALGGLEMMMGGDLMQAQAEIRKSLGVPALIILAIVMAAYVFAQANVAAKRARDSGLPGWIFVFAIVVLSGVVGNLLSESLGKLITFLALLWLLFAPSDFMDRSKS